MPLSPDLESILHPAPEPYGNGFLEVSALHTIHWQAYGNKDGIPVVCLHGGPGSGMSSWHPRLFDPATYHIILFDQRGCGQSTPFAELTENTTPHLIADMELLRTHFGLESWNVFGGSWGSTLALAYADAHPERVRNLLLYGIFLAREKELAAITDPDGPAALLYPEYYEKFCTFLPEGQRARPAESYKPFLQSTDTATQENACRSWCHWEMRIMDLIVSEDAFNPEEEDTSVLTSLSLLEHHYFEQNGFIDGDQILQTIGGKLTGKGVAIIQGRYDLVCPAVTAYELHKAIPHSTLHIIPDAGHTAKHPGTMRALMESTNILT